MHFMQEITMKQLIIKYNKIPYLITTKEKNFIKLFLFSNGSGIINDISDVFFSLIDTNLDFQMVI